MTSGRPTGPVHHLVPVVLAAILAVAGPVTATAELVGARAAVAVGVSGAVAAWGLVRRSWAWWVLFAVAVFAGVVGSTNFAGGLGVGAWSAIAVVVGVWAGGDRPPVARWPRVTRGVLPAVAATTAVAAWRATSSAWPSVVVAVASTIFVVLLGAFAGGIAMRVVRGFGAAVGALVGIVCFSVLSIPLVVLPWLFGRVAGLNPLAAFGGWSRRLGGRAEPSALWARETSRRPTPSLVRVVAAAAAMLLIAGVMGAGIAVLVGDDGALIPAAYADAPWYPTYFASANWLQTSEAYRPFDDIRVQEMHSRFLNVVDGQRVTWLPPACGCRRLRVWMYGGSTTFGTGQRDEHTVPSELARAGWAAGYALDIENRGVGADTQFQEARRFAWDLAKEPPPDLVVFYDGINEVLAAQVTRDPLEPPDQVKDRFWQEYLQKFPAPDIAAPAGASAAPRPSVAPRTAEGWGRLIVDRYERSRRTSATMAAQFGVPALYFWQPSIEHRDPVPGEESAGGLPWARQRSDAMRAALAPDVIDITQVFDGIDRPLFYDGVHTNEEGARLVAQAIFDHSRAVLDRALQAGSVPG